MSLFDINAVKHIGREPLNFRLLRENGSGDYIFIHFISSVDIIFHGKTIEAAPNSCIIYSPTFRQEFHARKEPLIHNWIHYVPSKENVLKEFNLAADEIFYPRNTDFITDIVRTVELEYINRPAYWEYNIDGHMLSLLSMVARENLTTEKDFSYNYESRRNFELLRLEIYNNPKENWDVEKMTIFVGMSRSRFSVLYKKFFNVSPVEDLINVRLERAKYLLSTTNSPISYITGETGYESIEHFIRQFKSKTGHTPTEYRKKSKKL